MSGTKSSGIVVVSVDKDVEAEIFYLFIYCQSFVVCHFRQPNICSHIRKKKLFFFSNMSPLNQQTL